MLAGFPIPLLDGSFLSSLMINLVNLSPSNALKQFWIDSHVYIDNNHHVAGKDMCVGFGLSVIESRLHVWVRTDLSVYTVVKMHN
jgi:hypothetical protein